MAPGKGPFLLFPCLLIASVSAQLKPCYRYDGTPAPDFPCDPEAAVSACCGGGWICVTNLHCRSADDPDNVVDVIGTCTDETWEDPRCPFKLDSGHYTTNFDHFNYTLNTTECSDGTICPFPNNQTCCFNHDGIEEVDYDNLDVVPTAATALNTYYAVEGLTIPTTGFSSPVPTSFSSFSGSITTTTTSSPTSSTPKTPTLAKLPTVSTSTPTPAAGGQGGLSTGAKAGIGVGVTLGVLIGLLAGFLLWRRLRKQAPPSQNTTGGVEEKKDAGPEGMYMYPKPELTGDDSRHEMDGEQPMKNPLMAHEMPS